MDWKTCIDEGNSVKITPDNKRANFLISRSEETLSVLKKIKIDDNNCSVFFANYYDALLELLHALMYFNGYKVRNHYCLGYYLRDVLKDKKSYEIFDRARTIRNSTIYYGNKFDKNIYDDMIKQMLEIFNKLKKLV